MTEIDFLLEAYKKARPKKKPPVEEKDVRENNPKT